MQLHIFDTQHNTTVMQKMAGLEVKCVFSWDLSRVILKIRCPQDRLEEVAEKMHIKLKNREGAIRRFKVCQLSLQSMQLSSALLRHMSCYALIL